LRSASGQKAQKSWASPQIAKWKADEAHPKVSAYQKLNDSWSVMGNLVWQNWSQFGEPEISVADTSVSNETAHLNYDDTWGFALGAQYAFAEGWLWSVGGAFDTSPMSKSERSPAIPLDQQYRLVSAPAWLDHGHSRQFEKSCACGGAVRV
jgi:hypothetical protein